MMAIYQEQRQEKACFTKNYMLLLADFVRKPLHKLRIQFCDNDRLVISG